MKIKTRLGLSFGIIVVLFLVVGGMFVYQNYYTREALIKIEKQNENSDKANRAIRNILEIKDLLTNASLTHEAESFKTASEKRKTAEKLLTGLMGNAIDSGDTEAQAVIGSLIQQLQVFYASGINMAHTYINDGHVKGYIKMVELDREASILDKLTDNFIVSVEEKVGRSLDQIRSKNLLFMKAAAVIIIVTLFLVIFITLSTVSFIVKPLNTMVNVSKSISQKDLTVTVDYSKNNELGHLGENLNEAVLSLRENIAEMQNSSDMTVKVKDELAASTEETSSAINEISANNIAMTKQIEELNRHIMDSTGSITEIDSNIQQLGDLIDDQAAMVVQATSAVNEMIASIANVAAISESKKDSTKQLVLTSRTGGEKLAVTNNIIREISDRVSDIQEMLEIINAIASQTNLLSMNAAIEAAHAGDAGKGFAVVADEIRKLAESTSENAKNIGEVIGAITGSIESAYNAGVETSRAFEDIQNEVTTTEQALNEISASTTELKIGGEEILKAMTQLTDVSENIKEGAKTMNDESRIVAKAMNDVENISGSVNNGMGEVTLGIQEISRAMNDLNDIAQQLGENSDKLDSIIKQFKV